MELICSVQAYAWGKKGKNSTVAQLAASGNHIKSIEDTPYAELWMGDHPNGPSRIKATNQLLGDFIKENPQALGNAEMGRFGNKLPYLFKVLSISKALSIQAHPSKKHAEELNVKFPLIYKDPNHKPEIAIALTNFEAMCGFRPTEEINYFIQEVPELRELIGQSSIKQLQQGDIRGSFTDLMACDSKKVSEVILSILSRKVLSQEFKLVERLNKDFPNDVGVLCVFWLNYVTLAPGEALFLAPNEPHAYLSGDCVENMANSDNVVRAGLTPKFRDVATLCDMLTYKSYTPSQIKFRPEKIDSYSTTYTPPVEDFAVVLMQVPKGESFQLKLLDSASIVLARSGTCVAKSDLGSVDMKAGTVLFVPAGKAVVFTVTSDVTIFRAYCNCES